MDTDNYSQTLDKQRHDLVDFCNKCTQESRLTEKQPRRAQNALNWDYFHGTIDWSHKRDEDPRIHLHKIGIAAERMRAKFKQALMKYDQWLIVEREYGAPDNPALPEFAAKNLLIKHLNYAKAKSKISDAILRAGIESRLGLKVSGKYVTQPRFVSEKGKLVRKEKKVWQLDLKVLPFEDFHVDVRDPDGKPIYRIEDSMVPLYCVQQYADKEPSADKPFRQEAVDSLSTYLDPEKEEVRQAAKGNYEDNMTLTARKEVLVQNFFGTVLDESGKIYEWKNADGEIFPLEDVFFVCANGKELLTDPTRIKRWSGKAPYVYSDLIRSPENGRKALLDAGTLINQAEDELTSLMLAGAIKATHNVTWYRKSWFADKRQASGGIKDGDSIAIDDSAPPNADPIGTVETGKIPQEAFAMQGTLDRVFAENVISNQIDLSGNLPGKQVRATELVQAGTAISDVTDSIGMDIEEVVIAQLAEEALYEIVQNIDDCDEDEVRACFGMAQDLAEQFLQMSPQERFEQIRGTLKFYGKGLRGLIANQAKAQALINLLNTMMANPLTMQAVETEVSAGKLFKQIAKGFAIDLEEIAPDAQEQDMIRQKQLIREQALAMSEMQQGQGGSPMGQSGGATNQPGSGQGSVQ